MSLTTLGLLFLEVLTCIVEIEKLNAEKNSPLFLERTAKGLRLASPTFNKWKSVLDFQNNNVIIGCPGLKNYILYGDEMFGDRLEGSCSFSKSGRSEVIKIGERLYNIYKFKCQNRLESYEIATNRSSCCDNSTIYKIGYVVNNELFPLFGGCHHEETGRTLWTRHKILGVGMVHLKSNYTYPNMKNNNLVLFKKMDINEAFILRNQRKKLEQAMGKSKSKMALKRNMDVFTKTQLVPPEDFKLKTWKDSTFHYINIEFQWLPIKAGIWKSLENEIRKLAKQTEEDFTVLSGVSGLLELSDGEGIKQTLSMGDNGTLTIPKYFWKLVQNQKSACVGFIVPNFSVAYISNNMAKCPPCYVFGWRKLQGKEFSIKCCEYSILKRIVPEIPYMECNSVLRF